MPAGVLAATLNREARLLEAIRRHLRLFGEPPSYRELEIATTIPPQRIRLLLRQLQDRGLLAFTPGKARSIRLTDRLAGFSDTELELTVRARGGRIDWSRVPALAAVFGQGVTDRTIAAPSDLTHLLDQMD